MTLRAVDADIRSLLVAVAQVAGVNLVLAPEVRGRITVTLEDVPAREALDAVMEAAGLSSPAALRVPWGPTVFFDAPVRLDTLSAGAVARRFDVSAKLAGWVVELRRRWAGYRPGEIR